MDEAIGLRDEMKTLPEMPAVRATPPPGAGPKIELLPGIEVPAEAVRREYDPKCRDCSAGVATYVVAGNQRKSALCGCAIRRARKKIAAERERIERERRRAPQPVSFREGARVHERVGRLGKQLTALRAELAERESRAAAELAPLEEERRADSLRLQDAAASEELAKAELARLEGEIHQAEVQVGRLRERHAAARGALADAVHMQGKAREEMERLDAALTAKRHLLTVGTARLAKEIAKLERRLSGVAIHHPEVAALAGPPDMLVLAGDRPLPEVGSTVPP